jgi:uncharacterized membrane protein
MVVLSLAGLADALYFTLAYYGRVRKAHWVPEVLCAREDSTCVKVVRTSYARVFGFPNALLGMVYYLLLIGWALLGWNQPVVWNGVTLPLLRVVAGCLVAISAVTVALGFYLIHALRRKLHVHCPPCYGAHTINAALLVPLIILGRP